MKEVENQRKYITNTEKALEKEREYLRRQQVSNVGGGVRVDGGQPPNYNYNNGEQAYQQAYQERVYFPPRPVSQMLVHPPVIGGELGGNNNLGEQINNNQGYQQQMQYQQHQQHQQQQYHAQNQNSHHINNTGSNNVVMR